jgi:hypothetical protein
VRLWSCSNRRSDESHPENEDARRLERLMEQKSDIITVDITEWRWLIRRSVRASPP